MNCARGMSERAPVAGSHSLLEKAPFHRISGQPEGQLEMGSSLAGSSAPKHHFAKGGGIEGIPSQPLTVLDGIQGFESSLRSVPLRHGNRAVEGNYRRRTNREERVVQSDDSSPIGRFGCCGPGVHPRDRDLEMILAQLRSSRGQLEDPLALDDERLIPAGAILLGRRI